MVLNRLTLITFIFWRTMSAKTPVSTCYIFENRGRVKYYIKMTFFKQGFKWFATNLLFMKKKHAWYNKEAVAKIVGIVFNVAFSLEVLSLNDFWHKALTSMGNYLFRDHKKDTRSIFKDIFPIPLFLNWTRHLPSRFR